MTGNISKIQRFSVGDGPGIRTTVFMKGCPLHCLWCHNPETISEKPVLMFYRSRCKSCGMCSSVCANNVHILKNNIHSLDFSKCTLCGKCINDCINNALEINGSTKSVDDIMNVILQDIDFYKESGGGVTLSGGEPLIQHKFCQEISKECYNNGIDVLIDTSAMVDFSAFEDVLDYANEYYVDLKAATEKDYEKYTGGKLSLVINNITKLVEAKKSVTIRIPIIPDHNSTIQYAKKMAELLLPTGIKRIDLLPFHNLCKIKYEALGLKYKYENTESLKKDDLLPLLSAFDGFDVKITN